MEFEFNSCFFYNSIGKKQLDGNHIGLNTADFQIKGEHLVFYN